MRMVGEAGSGVAEGGGKVAGDEDKTNGGFGHEGMAYYAAWEWMLAVFGKGGRG